MNDPWISTTADLGAAIRFDSDSVYGLSSGIVAIDLSKVSSQIEYGEAKYSAFSDDITDVIAHDLAAKDYEVSIYH